MSKRTGNLSIHSENIFPIIKKWLYSDHDIFIRELISNACDAMTKLQRLKAIGEADYDTDTPFQINVTLDPERQQLVFEDNGIGMTAEEVEKYITQIAFSGAEEFIEKYKDKSDKEQIIGHFGLGFYSSFMVSELVEIETLSYKEGSEPVKWTCDGNTTYDIETGSRTKRGTKITLHLGEDGKDFNNEYRIEATIEKYCNFMPYPIYFDVIGKEKPEGEEDVEAKALNHTNPLYLKSPSECTDEEYKEFYKNTFHDFQEPLFWIHLNMDYPFNLKGILYFPKLSTQFDTLEGQIKLYNSQVFIADNLKEVIPEFLLLLKGVIDCPDLPLNVSRSFLQNDGFVQKISDYITKKVADKLVGMFKTDRENYNSYWTDLHPFIKFGSLKDPKFDEKVKDAILMKTMKDEYFTVEEYLAKYEAKVGKSIYYVTDAVQQAQYVSMLNEHGIDSVLLDHGIDQHFISHLEAKHEETKFKRVDSDLSDLLKDDQEEVIEESILDNIKEIFRKALNNEQVDIELQALKSKDISSMIVLSEESRRMQEMMKMYAQGNFDDSAFPVSETLVLNQTHPLVQHLMKDDIAEESKTLISEHLYDLAVLGQRQLSSDAMAAFIKRSNLLLEIATK